MQSQDDDKTIIGGVSLDLNYILQSKDGTTHKIEGEVIVGRGVDSDLLIDNKKISRKHAVLNESDNKLEVTDLNSSNGTFLNDKKLNAQIATTIKNGDVISFEKHKFTVVVEIVEQPQVIEEEVVEEIIDEDKTTLANLSQKELKKFSQSVEDNSKQNNQDSKANQRPQEETKEPDVKEVITKDTSENSSVKVEPTPEPTPTPEKVSEEIPTSWVEDSNSVDGTRMMDLKELDALRAGVSQATNQVSAHNSDISRLHCFIDGVEEIVELPITDMAQASGWEMGRDLNCDIVLSHPSVSNRHAQIIHQNGRWKIVNLVSTNGILVNGQKKLSAYLADGDKIGLGSVNLIFKTSNAASKGGKKPIPTLKIDDSKNYLLPIVFVLILIILSVLIYFYLK